MLIIANSLNKMGKIININLIIFLIIRLKTGFYKKWRKINVNKSCRN